MSRKIPGRRGALAVIAASALALVLGSQRPAGAGTLPANFQETIVFSGLTNPTVVRFASDGRVFVAEKSGVIKVFDNLADTTPTVFADLNANVYNFWDRGLLGMALDPSFPTRPYVYVLYAYDKGLTGGVPRWGTPGVYSDPCPTPPGATADGCVITGQLTRLTATGNTSTGTEDVLLTDWCQQYPSHSVGSLQFGADGKLYVSGGDGASFNFVDYGQDGNPLNPCGDPPAGIGGTETPPAAEGGALRSQDLRTSATLPGSAARSSASTPIPAQRWPTIRTASAPMRTRAASSPTGHGILSASRSGPGRTSSGSATWAGTCGRRSTGFRIPPRPSRTSAGPATRA